MFSIQMPEPPDFEKMLRNPKSMPSQMSRVEDLLNKQLLESKSENALLAEQLQQSRDQNKELQDKLDAEIIKSEQEKKKYLKREVLISLISATITWIASQIYPSVIQFFLKLVQ